MKSTYVSAYPIAFCLMFARGVCALLASALVHASEVTPNADVLHQRSWDAAIRLGMTEANPDKRLVGCGDTWAFLSDDNSPGFPESAPLPVLNLVHAIESSLSSGAPQTGCKSRAPDARGFVTCELPSTGGADLRWRYSNDGRILIQLCVPSR